MGWPKAYAVCVGSMLAGAAAVHNLYKPDIARLDGSGASGGAGRPRAWPRVVRVFDRRC